MPLRGPYNKYYDFNSRDNIPRSTAYKKEAQNKVGTQNITPEESLCRNQLPESSDETDSAVNPGLSKDDNDQSQGPPWFQYDNYIHDKFRLKDGINYDALQETICNFSNINLAEVLLIFLYIMKKHSLTWIVILDIFGALNFILKKNILPTTKYMIHKLLNLQTDCLTYHAICPDCNKYLGKYVKTKLNVQCTCGSKLNPKPGGSLFIEVDMINQLEKLFSNNTVTSSLQERFSRQKINLNGLEDIYDGALYQHLKKKETLNNAFNYSFTFNTDGCKDADSSKVTVWPIYVMIHELPNFLRKKFMILVGLWVAKTEPQMNVFLQPFIEQANRLSSQGFEWIYNGIKIQSKLFPLGCCVDSVARCAILNMKRFNGIYGCTYCEHPTSNINGVRKYPMLVNAPRNRTDKTVRNQMVLAFENNDNNDVTGVWGPSGLINLNYFDLVRGMVVDFMHACLLGVTELYTDIVMTSAFKDFYVGSPAVTSIIDHRLLSIKPPTCIGKIPRSIKERNNWKTSEWLVRLLFYSLPCFQELLKKNI